MGLVSFIFEVRGDVENDGKVGQVGGDGERLLGRRNTARESLVTHHGLFGAKEIEELLKLRSDDIAGDHGRLGDLTVQRTDDAEFVGRPATQLVFQGMDLFFQSWFGGFDQGFVESDIGRKIGQEKLDQMLVVVGQSGRDHDPVFGFCS